MTIYRASELGSCIRAQVARQLGMKELPTPDFLQAAFDRGVAHEEECIAAMRAENMRITFEQQEVDLTIIPEVLIRGHLDGVLTRYGDPQNYLYPQDRVLEIKAPAAWAKFEKAYKTGDWSDPLAHRYAWQISVYMVATGLEAVVACLDEGTIKTFGIEVSPFSREEISDRVLQIESYMELPETCSQDDYPCPFVYLHGDAPEIIEDALLDEMVEERAMWIRSRDSSDQHVKELTARLKAHLGDEESLTTASSKVTRFSRETKTFQREAAEAKFGDLSEFYKVTTSEQLKVTRRGDAETT